MSVIVTEDGVRIGGDAPTVLHVRVMAGSGGGPEKTIVRSPRHADPRRYRMAAAYIHPAGNPNIAGLREQAKRQGCPLFTIPERGAMDPATVAALLRLCRLLNVKVWHAHDYKSDLLGLLLRPLHPMALVTTAHGWTDETARIRFYRRVDQLCLRRYGRVMAVSDRLAEQVIAAGVDRRRVRVIGNGIDLSEYPRSRCAAEAKAGLGLDPARPVVGVVGRLSIEKGVDRLIGPLREIARRVPGALALVIGDGPERGALEAAVRGAGLEGAVEFCGWRSPLQAWYEAMDVLALPSRTEGMPNVVLEAMAMGVAVAATDVGAVRELLDDGRCGVMLGDDEAGWAGAIGGLLEDAGRRRELAGAARERVERRYSFARRIAAEMAVYDEALKPCADCAANKVSEAA